MSRGDAGTIGIISHPFVGKKVFVEGGGEIPANENSSQIPKENLENFVGEYHALFLIGRACYQDIFREDDFTNFCLFWQKKNGVVSDARPCLGEGNRADRNPEK
jgi:hypothetical protein